jgi:basic membrane lipoprotein Med (substrate-binding protein (PBP1-ABC) superfamily)
MSVTEYTEAQKLGEKYYRAAVAKKEYPYLPVLDELISSSDIDGEVNLGLQQVSLSKVVGTATSGRTTAFAGNFMPILEYKTEFGSKWSSLCDSHVAEGIHDPIKAYEYMNKYYVVEGNKRVSVLKYFGADSVPAMVTRKIPKRTDELENKIYFEYIDFHKQTGINYVWFSQLGGFDKLRELIGITPDKEFTDDERLDFNSAHLAFEKAFVAKNASEKLPITVEDAMLVFMNVYGYENLKNMTPAEVKANLDKVWDEIHLVGHKKENVITPKLEPVESKKKLFAITTPKKLKVAFVYDKEPENSVWIYSHDLGRAGIEAKFKGQIETAAFSDIDDNVKLSECLNSLVENKYDVIFTTGPEMLPVSLKVAVEHPETKILNCSLNLSTSHVRTYYARMYEAKFLTGIIAGSLCEDGKIGYVADYPIYGTTADINSFAMGAKLVNPRAKIYLEWSKVKNADPKKKFKEMGISYVSDRDMITPQNASREFGLYNYEENEVANLAMPFYNWQVFYEKIIQLILDGNWKLENKGEKTKVLNYWWGMSAGVIDLICSNHLPVGTTRLVNLMKQLIKEGQVTPFHGKLYSQNGVVHDDEDGEMGPEEIMKMNWLCENVVGSIPDLEDLVDDARDVVTLQGVNTPENLELKKSTD